MNQELLEQVKNRIDDLEAEHALENTRIFLFGMNTPGDRVIQYLNMLGHTVEGVLDNNKLNHGKKLYGVTVYSPDILKDTNPADIRVLICSRYYREMSSQLQSFGLIEGENIIKLINLDFNISASDSEAAFEQAVSRLQKDSRVYEEITRSHNEKTWYMLCPICANGDMYIAASLMENVKAQYGCESIYLVTVGGMGIKVAGLFGESNVINVTQEQMDALLNVISFLGEKAARMYVLYHKAFHYGIFANMECYKGLNYMDFLAGGMLGLDMKSLHRSKTKGNMNDKAEYVLTDKDVLLAPYANSLPCFLPEFWVELVNRLKAAGYNVYTNSSGDKEPPVEGTLPLFLPIKNIIQELNHCAGFIAIRNGLCDILAEAECKKIVIYPHKGMGLGSVCDFYSLTGMGLCEDAIELIYSEDNEDEIINLAVNNMEERC